jgi:hypothetical protein
MQIVQFVFLIVLSVPFFFISETKGYHSWSLLFFAEFVTASFLILFLDFYRKNYHHSKKPATKQVSHPKVEETKEGFIEESPSPARTTPRRKAKSNVSYSEISPGSMTPTKRTTRKKRHD